LAVALRGLKRTGVGEATNDGDDDEWTCGGGEGRTRTPVHYLEPLPKGLYRAIAADREDPLSVDRVQDAHRKGKRAVLPMPRGTQKTAA
jgi:hypothetical protein